MTLLLLALLTATAVQAPASAPAPLAAETRRLVEGLLARGDIAIASRFDARMRAALSDDQLRQAVTSVATLAGDFKSLDAERVVDQNGVRAVIVQATYARGLVDVTVAWQNGAVVGLNLRPAAAKPTGPSEGAPYVDRSRFDEREVTVDAGRWPLPGVLSMPKGAGPFAAVILVHGSGPQDRDGSVGPNRVFRDLAFGLAARGIAVLRYDKRTLTHRERVARLREFTVHEETIDDAVAAAALLRRTKEVRADRIFVAGHSHGGMFAPRIGEKDRTLAGLIVLAGAVRPLAETILSQVEYLARLDGAIAPDERTQIAAAEEFVRKVAALKPGDPPVSGPFASAPSGYLLDLRGYDPPRAARELRMPVLVLQGERDYQVTMADFERWKAALRERTDVTARSFPRLNHLFMAGTGPGSPAEYQTPGHVDAEVVAAIAGWVLAR